MVIYDITQQPGVRWEMFFTQKIHTDTKTHTILQVELTQMLSLHIKNNLPFTNKQCCQLKTFHLQNSVLK